MCARRALFCALAALALLTSPVRAQDASAEPEVPPDVPASYRQPPRWRWVQVLATPRVGARLTAVEVDPRDPDKIYVGSQSGVIFHSADGGVTWRELEPDAFTANRRDVLPPGSGAAREPGAVGPGSVNPSIPCVFPDCSEVPLTFTFPGNPTRPPTGSATSLVLRQLPDIARGTTFPRGTFLPTYTISDVFLPPFLLTDALRSRRTEEVRRIIVCPGSAYPLVVATRREVVASPDEGYTWVRLLRFSGSVRIPQIACDPTRTNHLIIATDAGYQESRDGGVTLDPNLAGYPRGAVQAAAFGSDGSLYLGSRFQLFKRPVDEVDAQRVYPDFNNSETAPWEPILWVEPDGDDVWLGTQDGLRHSEDHGRRFTTVAPNLFSRQVIPQVVVGTNETGGRRVAAIVRDCPRTAREPTSPGCRGTLVLSSDDGGDHWDPFFQGITRRSIQQMAFAGGRWFIVTGGELWMTSRTTPGAVSQDVVTSARRALARTPAMSTVIDLALDRAELNQEQVDSLIERSYASAWLPRRVSVQFQLDVGALATASQTMVTMPSTTSADSAASFFYVWGFLEWDLTALDPSGPVAREPFRRQALYALRQQISFLIEDAWHERRMHLRRLARGFADAYQAAVLEERIEVLEAVMEFWLGRELEELAPSPRRRR